MNETNRRGFLQRAVALGATLSVPGLVAACGDGGGSSAATSAAARATRTGTLRTVVNEPFSGNWYPYTQTAGVERRINQLLFDRLVEVTPSEPLAPGLAESWQQVDERTWEFRLRRDVTFQDGKPFAAEDVKASVELASGATGEQSVISALYGVPQQVEVVDDHTVRISGRQPLGPLLSLLATTDILSAADVRKGVRALGRAPNGTGPFRLVEDGLTRKRMERYADYFRGPAKLRTTVWEFIQDPQSRINALQAGQTDLVDRVAPDEARRLASRRGIQVQSVVSAEIQLLLFRGNKRPLQGNPALRRAIGWAIDREALAGLVGGETLAASSHLAPANFFYAEQSPMYTYDPEQARAELRAAGVTTPIQLEFIAAEGAFPKVQECVETITQQLGEIGIDARITLLELGAYFDALGNGQGDLIYAGWNSAAPDPQLALGSMYSPTGAGGLWGVNDPRLARMLTDGVATGDEAAREALYGDIQAYMWESLPALPLFYQQLAAAYRDGVVGVELQPTPQIDYWPIQA